MCLDMIKCACRFTYLLRLALLLALDRLLLLLLLPERLLLALRVRLRPASGELDLEADLDREAERLPSSSFADLSAGRRTARSKLSTLRLRDRLWLLERLRDRLLSDLLLRPPLSRRFVLRS